MEDSISDENQNIKEKDDKAKEIEDYKKKSFILNRKDRWILFFIFTLVKLLNNFDHGTIPAATDEVKSFLKLDDSELGVFGSLVFIGVLIGSFVSSAIINLFNRKYILIVFLSLNSVFLFIFTITKIHIIIYIDRVIIGFFQAFISIYLPLWSDQFGIGKRKTLMLGLFQAVSPLGVLVGYTVTTLLNLNLMYFPFYGDIDRDKRWIFSFYIQSFSFLFLSIFLVFFKDKYFDSKIRRIPHEIEEALNKEQSQISYKNLKSLFIYDEKQSNEDLKDENKIDEKEPKEQISFLEKIKIIFSEPLFIFCMLTLSVIYFIATCVQYWASDYIEHGLGVKDQHQQLYAFIIVCSTSPTLGLIIGGFIVDKLGGYRKKSALIFGLVMSVLASIPAIPLPFVNSLIAYSTLLWAVLFFGYSFVGTFQGIIITCLPKNAQGWGYSFYYFLSHLLGYLPAPTVYGFLKEHFDVKNDDQKRGSRMALRFTMWIIFICPIFIIIAALIRFIKEKEYNEKMEKDKVQKAEKENLYEDDDDDEKKEKEKGLIEIKNIDKKTTL